MYLINHHFNSPFQFLLQFTQSYSQSYYCSVKVYDNIKSPTNICTHLVAQTKSHPPVGEPCSFGKGTKAKQQNRKY